MGKLMPTIRERWEEARRKQAEVPTMDIAAEQAAAKARTKAFDAQHVLPVAQRPKCRWCGSTLRLFRWRAYDNHAGKDRTYGDYGDNLFCGLRCGYEYGKYRAPK